MFKLWVAGEKIEVFWETLVEGSREAVEELLLEEGQDGPGHWSGE